MNAGLDKASAENERQHLLIERGDGLKIGFTQIAGLVAQRIVPFVKPGDMLAVGQRIGLILLRQPGRCLPSGWHESARADGTEDRCG